ncbi:MAG: hypothetical protein LBO06_02945 [Bacteroidales bacterium]|jgi:hypothetical protein|nr:hypothetical protein [Bacteroidales bacterium]
MKNEIKTTANKAFSRTFPVIGGGGGKSRCFSHLEPKESVLRAYHFCSFSTENNPKSSNFVTPAIVGEVSTIVFNSYVVVAKLFTTDLDFSTIVSDFSTTAGKVPASVFNFSTTVETAATTVSNTKTIEYILTSNKKV